VKNFKIIILLIFILNICLFKIRATEAVELGGSTESSSLASSSGSEETEIGLVGEEFDYELPTKKELIDEVCRFGGCSLQDLYGPLDEKEEKILDNLRSFFSEKALSSVDVSDPIAKGMIFWLAKRSIYYDLSHWILNVLGRGFDVCGLKISEEFMPKLYAMVTRILRKFNIYDQADERFSIIVTSQAPYSYNWTWDQNRYLIYISLMDIFASTPEELEFIIAHECAHAYCKHYPLRGVSKFNLVGRIRLERKVEKEADLLAVVKIKNPLAVIGFFDGLIRAKNMLPFYIRSLASFCMELNHPSVETRKTYCEEAALAEIERRKSVYGINSLRLSQ
jgi:hypothetical protein